MRLVLRYQTADGINVRIKSGVFRRMHVKDDGTSRVLSRYTIIIYNDFVDASRRGMQLYEEYRFENVPAKDRRRIDVKLKELVAQRLNPDDLENAIEMFTEDIFNEE